MSQNESPLWNRAISGRDYESPNDKHMGAILEQYKLYVEMADRVSQRRGVANAFFLTLNTAILAALGTPLSKELAEDPLIFVLQLLGVIAQCLGWYLIVRSYRQLSSAKWAVVAMLESKLPAFAYSEGEWNRLSQGHDWRAYLPLSRLEQWLPATFAAMYVAAFIAVLAT